LLLEVGCGKCHVSEHQFGTIDFERLHPQSLGHDRGEKIDAKKKKNDVAVSLGVLGIALEGCIQHEGRTC